MRRNNRQKLAISLFILALLSIGLVYAYLTSNLSITGATEISANSWDIHFANLVVNPDSVEATTPATINPSDNTKITYTVKLNRPKDFYEFTVDVVNAGSLPGKVDISTISGITAEVEDIVNYTVNYTNGNPVQIGDILNGGATKSIKVRVNYKDDITEDDLPSTNLNLTLTFTLKYVQSEEDEFDTNALINQLKTENTSCFTKYEGQVTDQVGETVTANHVYFNRCVDKRNIIFGGSCWQMIRTTETGGIKMIYNGDVVDNKCLNTRGDHKGIVGAGGTTQTLNAEYLYGDSFTYDITNNTFTLTDTITATWSDSTYENLLGKFTCKNTNGTCTTLYNVNGYSNNTTAYISSYTIGDTNYAQIGTSSFNANCGSPAMVGYMFNKVYNYKFKGLGTNTYKYGNTFTYDSNTGNYTLSGTTQDISDWSTGYNQISNTHYTCWNDTGICSTISFIYYTNSYIAEYFNMSGGKNIRDILEEMLSYNDVNRYNSSIKGIIDAWYKQNLISKTNMLEDTVYCNARDIPDYGEWNPDELSPTINIFLQFKNYRLTNLACPNVTDQFVVGNILAKLTYPVSLISNEEWYYMGTTSLRQTGATYWGLSPLNYHSGSAYMRSVFNDGSYLYDYFGVHNSYGSRPAVTLSTGTVISSGDGSEESPWIIEE